MAPVKKKKENVRNLRYPDSAMQLAIKAVREGRFKLREAGRHYGVPHNTLSNKLRGLVPEERKMGRVTYLTVKEEKLLESYLVANAKKGFPLKRHTLADTVKNIIDEDGRKTPFKGNRPGRKWLDLFKKRHPQLSEKKSESISTARANVSEADLRQWFDSLKKYLTDEQALEILDDPTRIYNADESGFQTCPQSGTVIGPVGMKNFYEVKSGKEKEQLTVMACINAAGQTISPMIVYPLVRISKDIACNVPTEWSIGRSRKGWMTGPLYFEYIANVLDPWLKSQNIKKPVLLLVDGHRSHMTLQVSEYCAENQILVHALYPNSTHITQPADVSLFKCLKSGWQNIVFEYKQKTGNKKITRAGFAPLLFKVFEDKVTPQIITNGFKRCGIYPFDPSAVDYSKCMENEVRQVSPITAEVGVETVLFLESFMRSGRAEQFRRAENEEWQGDESAKELFYVWKKLRRHCSLGKVAGDEVAQDETDKQGADNPSEVSEPRSASSPSPGQSYKPSSPSIIKTPPRFLQTESTSCSSVSSPEKTHPDPKSHGVVSRNYHGCRENVIEEDLRQRIAGSRTPETAMNSSRRTSITSPETNLEIQSQNYVPRNESEGSLNNTSLTAETTDRTKMTPNTKLIQIMAQKQKQISPAFGNHVIFPSDSPIKKNTKERIPLAVTSKAFQRYLQDKEQEKQKKNEEIERRKRKREENRNKKIQNALKTKNMKLCSGRKQKSRKSRRPVISSDSETDNHEDQETEDRQKKENEETSDSENTPLKISNNNTRKISKGDYVIIIYEMEYFPGRVEDIHQNSYEISTMTFSSGNTFRWPEKPDKIWYSEKDIVERICAPILTNKRGFYLVKEMSKFLPFTV